MVFCSAVPLLNCLVFLSCLSMSLSHSFFSGTCVLLQGIQVWSNAKECFSKMWAELSKAIVLCTKTILWLYRLGPTASDYTVVLWRKDGNPNAAFNLFCYTQLKHTHIKKVKVEQCLFNVKCLNRTFSLIFWPSYFRQSKFTHSSLVVLSLTCPRRKCGIIIAQWIHGIIHAVYFSC